MNMKQFNLEEYLKNPSRKIVTRDGRKVRIICTDRKTGDLNDCSIVGLLKDHNSSEKCLYFTPSGKIFDGCENPCDLFFAPEKKEGWVNVYKSKRFNRALSSIIFSSEKDAKDAVRDNDNYITTTKIEWEE